MLGFTPIAAAPLASAGTGGITVILSATEAKDIASFIADGGYAVYLAAVEATDTAAINADIVAGVYLYATDSQDTAVFVIENINIDLAATEASDIAALTAGVFSVVAMSAVEAQDSYSQNAFILWLTPTQPDDPTIWVPKNDPTPYLTTVI